MSLPEQCCQFTDSAMILIIWDTQSRYCKDTVDMSNSFRSLLLKSFSTGDCAMKKCVYGWGGRTFLIDAEH